MNKILLKTGLDEIKSVVPAEAFIDPAIGEQLQYVSKDKDFTLTGELIKK